MKTYIKLFVAIIALSCVFFCDFVGPMDFGSDGGDEGCEDPNIPYYSTTLYQNHPNPFTDSTTIGFSFSYEPNEVNDGAWVKLYVESVVDNGSSKDSYIFVTLIDSIYYEEGYYMNEVIWYGSDEEGSSVPDGEYQYTLELYWTTGHFSTRTKNMFKNIECLPPLSLTAILQNGNVHLSWMVPEDYYQYVTNYKVYRDDEFLSISNDLSFIDSDVTIGIYSYYVTAMYNELESEPSNLVIIEIPYLPPRNLTAILQDGNVYLFWMEPAEGWNQYVTYYNIYRNDEFLSVSNDLSFVDSDVTIGIYSYYVTAMYGEYESDPSNKIIIEIPGTSHQ